MYLGCIPDRTYSVYPTRPSTVSQIRKQTGNNSRRQGPKGSAFQKKKSTDTILDYPQVTSSHLHSINAVLCIFLAFFSFPRSMTIFLNTGQLSNILRMNLTDPQNCKDSTPLYCKVPVQTFYFHLSTNSWFLIVF